IELRHLGEGAEGLVVIEGPQEGQALVEGALRPGSRAADGTRVRRGAAEGDVGLDGGRRGGGTRAGARQQHGGGKQQRATMHGWSPGARTGKSTHVARRSASAPPRRTPRTCPGS